MNELSRPFSGGARHWCPCTAAPASAARDALLYRLLDDVSAPRGWLPASGGLLANLRVWENVLLIAGFGMGAPTQAELQRLCTLFAGFGEPAPQLLLQARVDHLNRRQRALVCAVRTLMSAPRLIVADSEWFSQFEDEMADRLAQQFARYCPEAGWLVIGPACPAAIWGAFAAIETEGIA
ncbi:hypothetical protein [Chitinimonas sp.]|uniref:hypothetical protein n=1 Tax=Chitinimonas sp. TaxID=1934313 RepID=UPI0035B00779